MKTSTFTDYQEFMLTMGMLGFALSVLILLVLVPFYRRASGVILFSVKVNTLLLLATIFLTVKFGSGFTGQSVIRDIVYTTTAVSGFAISALILRAQVRGIKNSRSAVVADITGEGERMTETDPDWNKVADQDDTLDWNRQRDGRMEDAVAKEPVTVPVLEEPKEVRKNG